MQGLLTLSRAIDWLNSLVGRYIIWLIMAATVVSGVNAVMRKAFDLSSNAFLEVQWYLFATSFLLAAGHTLLSNEHVKIDVIYGRWSRRTQIKIDIFGFLFFLIPVCITVLYLSVPFFVKGYVSGETSSNAGGLVRWPIYLMMPLGFTLLLLQGISELIKRVAFLKGLADDPAAKGGKSAEEELAEEIRRAAEAKPTQA